MFVFSAGVPWYKAAMNPNKALWEKGDFTVIAATMREAGAAFVKTLGVAPGMKVLDLGCGDGTTAVPLAQLGADVMGIDIASNLVAAGTRRAAELGLTNRGFRKAMPATWKASQMGHLSYRFRCLGRCLLRSLWMWRRRWCA